MKPPAFDYIEPDDLDTAVALLSADEDARPLGGGQSLVPMLSFRLAQPTLLVGLRRLEALRQIDHRDGELVIGAMVTQSDALSHPGLAVGAPLVADALRLIGHPQIRARGTVGGSVAHADPAAELPAALLTIDGAVTAHGPNGTRTIPTSELFFSHYVTSLQPGEIITAVHCPVAPPNTGSACVELSRRHGDFAVMGAACQVTLGGDGSIDDARVGLFAVAEKPVRARAVEDAVKGSRPTPDVLASAAKLAVAGWSEEVRSSAQGRYRTSVAPTIVARALTKAVERAA